MINELADKLLVYLKESEKKELECTVRQNKISIYPRNSVGNPNTDITARPTIECRLDKKKNTIILSWLYLITTNKGIGSEVIKIILAFAKAYDIEAFAIRNIDNNNKAMLKMASKFDFEIIKDNVYESFSLYLHL